MDVAEGLPEEFALLRRELAGIPDRRFARGLAHPPVAALSRRRRTVKVSGELAGYGGFPGLAPVVMARREAGGLRRAGLLGAFSRA